MGYSGNVMLMEKKYKRNQYSVLGVLTKQISQNSNCQNIKTLAYLLRSHEGRVELIIEVISYKSELRIKRTRFGFIFDNFFKELAFFDVSRLYFLPVIRSSNEVTDRKVSPNESSKPLNINGIK